MSYSLLEKLVGCNRNTKGNLYRVARLSELKEIQKMEISKKNLQGFFPNNITPHWYFEQYGNLQNFFQTAKYKSYSYA